MKGIRAYSEYAVPFLLPAFVDKFPKETFGESSQFWKFWAYNGNKSQFDYGAKGRQLGADKLGARPIRAALARADALPPPAAVGSTFRAIGAPGSPQREEFHVE